MNWGGPDTVTRLRSGLVIPPPSRRTAPLVPDRIDLRGRARSDETGALEEAARFTAGRDTGDGPAPSGRDRTYLAALEPLLDMYPEMRMGGGE